jgi:sortase A
MRRTAAVCLVACGLLLLSWHWLAGPVASFSTHRTQSALLRDVPDGPAGATRGSPAVVARAVAPAHALAVMRIPRFGRPWVWAASEGVSPDVLANGPGHYPRTALPGARGNAAFAGHRAGHGDPFIDFDRLRRGDRVFLTQGATTWVYRLDGGPRIVPTEATWVLDPMRRGHRLTLTTCWPKYGSAKRMYVRGRLVQTRTHAPVGSITVKATARANLP